MLIGLLRFNEQPSSRDRVAIMQIKERGHEAVFFNFNGIDYQAKTIAGKTLEAGKWEKISTRFPDVVYNDLAPINRMDPRIYERLEKQGIPFTTHRIETDLFKLLHTHPALKPYILPRQSLTNFLELRLFLEQHRHIELLPVQGAEELVLIASLHLLDNSKIDVHLTDGDKQLFNMAGLEQKLGSKEVLAQFYVQPNTKSLTKFGQPFLIRSYVGRNAKGAWCNVFHYTSISYSGDKPGGIGKGCAFAYIMDFLRLNYGDRAKKMHEQLNSAGLEIVEAIQSAYAFEIDALGLDFGIDNSGEFILQDVHTFPNMRPFEAIAEHHMIQFAIYLGQKHLKE